MEVQVSLYGMYRQYLPPDAPSATSFAVELAERATVATLTDRLGIPREKVRQVFVNGVPSGLEGALRPGAKVVFVPPSAGG
ncbi:MAG: MoaD/ThiS family protein [Dehalococcoidales bacterium]|nr:MoaD/ThiS family protein [Dehalococcoidales bacterium]